MASTNTSSAQLCRVFQERRVVSISEAWIVGKWLNLGVQEKGLFREERGRS